jgi:hypothetical protein
MVTDCRRYMGPSRIAIVLHTQSLSLEHRPFEMDGVSFHGPRPVYYGRRPVPIFYPA